MGSSVAPTQPAPPATTVDEGVDAGVSSIDLIIDLYKRDVDRTLIIEQLKKTPAQRMDDLQRFYDFAMEMRRAFASGR